jgi:tRNA(His) 5'-end guanylyltransferase
MDTSALAKRMKQYEAVPKNTLTRRTPVIIRVDGRAFHTFTRGFKKPFDDVLMQAMQDTMKYLCENIQGCVLGYTQSDEITLILVDYKKLNSEAWFDYEVQKMCSIVASMATLEFNRSMKRRAVMFVNQKTEEETTRNDIYRQFGVYSKAVNKGAMFDARVFNLPKEEVTNNIYWRQLDASRNSIQMLGQAHFSHKELQHKTCNQIQDMLMTQKGINWNDLQTSYKRGSCCVRNRRVISVSADGTATCEIRNPKKSEREWIIDAEIPIFKGDGRKYIDELILVGGVEI